MVRRQDHLAPDDSPSHSNSSRLERHCHEYLGPSTRVETGESRGKWRSLLIAAGPVSVCSNTLAFVPPPARAADQREVDGSRVRSRSADNCPVRAAPLAPWPGPD